MRENTNSSTPAKWLTMKTLISRRQVVARLFVHRPSNPVTTCKRTSGGSRKAARREANYSDSMLDVSMILGAHTTVFVNILKLEKGLRSLSYVDNGVRVICPEPFTS